MPETPHHRHQLNGEHDVTAEAGLSGKGHESAAPNASAFDPTSSDEPLPIFNERDVSADAEPIVDNAALAREPRSDVGNARRLVVRHGHNLRAIGDTRPGWISWDNRRWLLEGGRAVAMLRAHDTTDAIELEAAAREQLAAQAGSAGAKQDHDALQRKIAAHRKWSVASGNKSR